MAKKRSAKGKSKGSPAAAAKNGAASGPLKDLQELYAFMQSNGLQSLELDRKDYRVRLVRKGRATVAVPVPVPAAGHVPAAPVQPAGASVPAAAAEPALPANAHVVKSPMMGIFYRAASPSSPPFVKEGDSVKPGDVLCLIEAMKVFNDVKTEVGGIVRRVFLDNGKSVKVGQDLFVLERA